MLIMKGCGVYGDRGQEIFEGPTVGGTGVLEEVGWKGRR